MYSPTTKWVAYEKSLGMLIKVICLGFYFINYLAEEKRAGCFIAFVFVCVITILSLDAIGWFVIGSGSVPGFLERGLICIKVLGARFVNFISFFLNIP